MTNIIIVDDDEWMKKKKDMFVVDKTINIREYEYMEY